MEGSRHEKAILVGLAYFIGGLTAFIWYSHGLPLSFTTPFATNHEASVVTAVDNYAKPVEITKSIANYHDGILEIKAFGNDKVLSFNPDITGQIPGEGFGEQGTHYGKLAFSVSPSEEYVFFCEKKSEFASTCNPFVYDVVADTIYPVRLNNERVEILTTAADSVVWQQNKLQIDSEISRDGAKPWLLGY